MTAKSKDLHEGNASESESLCSPSRINKEGSFLEMFVLKHITHLHRHKAGSGTNEEVWATLTFFKVDDVLVK